jgi:peptidoglycan/xylan/chitin deacetylase (PgdA/CDA1 family)
VSTGPRVALTFDAEHPDRPHHGDHAAWVLDELERLDVRATVFIQGRWAEAYPDLARRCAEGGHLIGSHTFYHARVSLFSEDGFATDLADAERTILEITGVDPRPWLRFPFGDGADASDIVARLPTLGYRHIGWDLELFEWEAGCTAAELAARAVDGVRAHGDGAIVLLHTWPDPVAPALSEMVTRLRDEGARFVGVDELDLPAGLEPVALPRPGEAVAAT